jgi:5-methylcytosine-specific restriction endonuclease McrA
LNATRRPPREYARPPVRRGAANHKWVPALRFTCEQCGLEFERKPWRARGTANRFCSRPCLETFRRERESGENAPDWVGGPVTRRGRGWLRIRAQVVTEQGGNCAHCGRHVGKSLPVNHIRPFREFASAAEANQRDNLIGLCQPCHMRAERRPHRPNSRARRALASAT